MKVTPMENFRCVWWNQIHLTAHQPQPCLSEDSGLPFVKIILLNEEWYFWCFNSENKHMNEHFASLSIRTLVMKFTSGNSFP